MSLPFVTFPSVIALLLIAFVVVSMSKPVILLIS